MRSEIDHRNGSSATTTVASDQITVSSLLGRSHVPVALTCLGSLQRQSQDPVRFILHDDGSLTSEDIERLETGLPGTTIIRRRDADERMAESLSRHPASRKWREKNPLAFKVLDCLHYNPADNFAYCDIDVYFFRPFSGLFEFPDATTDALLATDFEHCYSVRSWGLALSPGLKLLKCVSSALIYFRRNKIDPDHIEWFLSKTPHLAKSYFLDQTCWSMLGAHASCRLWGADQIRTMMPDVHYSSQLVAGHFVSQHRQRMLPKFIELSEADPTRGNSSSVNTHPAARCRAVHLAACEAKRVVERAVHRVFPSSK